MSRLVLCSLVAALCALTPPLAAQKRSVSARYVRVELPGPGRMLQLAEVWAVVDGQNLAPEGTASQSSLHGDSAAARAIDGRTAGDHAAGSVSHTGEEANPWWELDLGREVPIDQVSLWNRTDCCGERLAGFRLLLLGEDRKERWGVVDQPPPAPRADFSVAGAAIVTPPPSTAEKLALQPAIDKAIDRGVEYLRATQLVDGSWSQHQGTHFGGQTALSLLTLLKAGVPADDPAVVAALSFLRANGSESTYGTGCLLMALEVLGDDAAREWAAALADQIVSTQGGEDASGKQPGMWTYPLHPNTTVCLSNTQYAILGLRSARRLGVDVPTRVFTKTLENLPKYQGEVERVKGLGGSDSRGVPVAGFQYRAEGGHGGTTGSMTTAALAVLHVCLEAYGTDVPKRVAADAQVLETAAWRWLDVHFALESNPNRGETWHYYYLYGLERVGAFFERPVVGGRDWYWEGARYLVAEQKGAGDWGDQSNTCFAVLFLKRATASSSGPTKRAANEVHVAEGDAAHVRWRGTGRAKTTFWLTGFGQELVTRFGGEANVRVRRIEYLVDGEPAASLEGDATRAWRPADRYAAQLDLGSRGAGKHEVRVRVELADPLLTVSTEGTLTYEGAPLVVDVPAVTPTDSEPTSHAALNLIASTRVTAVSASSENNDGQSAARAGDGLQSSYWLSKKDDPAPTWSVEFERPVRAGKLVLSHANTERRNSRAHDRAKVIEVRINRDKEVLRFELELDDRKKSILELPPGKQVRRLEVKVVERVPGERWPGHVGFAEVELLPAAPTRRR